MHAIYTIAHVVTQHVIGYILWAGISSALLSGGLSVGEGPLRVQRRGQARAVQRLRLGHGGLHDHAGLGQHPLPVREGRRAVHLLHEWIHSNVRTHPYGTKYKNGERLFLVSVPSMHTFCYIKLRFCVSNADVLDTVDYNVGPFTVDHARDDRPALSGDLRHARYRQACVYHVHFV